MIFQPLPPQLGQTVSVGMMFHYRADGRRRKHVNMRHEFTANSHLLLGRFPG
jgi:hypothetical protein